MTSAPDRQLREFLAEATAIVDRFESELALIERTRAAGGDAPAQLNECFRAVHSLKGLAGLAGRTHLMTVASTLEGLLGALRLGRLVLADQVMAVLHDVLPVLRSALAAATGGGDLDETAAADFEARVVGLRPDGATARATGSTDPLATVALPTALREVLTEYEEHRARENVRRGRRLFTVGRSLELATIDRDLERLQQAVRPLGEVIATVPGDDSGGLDRLHMRLLIASDAEPAAVEAAAAGAEVLVFEAPPGAAGSLRAAAEPAATPTPVSAPVIEEPDQTVPRIVVAHDEPAIRDSAVAVAREAGYQVIGVADGASARVLLLETRPVPAALVVDVALPGVLGYELCADIAAARLSTVVILIASVYSKTAYKRRPSNLYGADDYVEQHHVVDQLADKLARLVPGPAASVAGGGARRRREARAIQVAGEGRLAFEYGERSEGTLRAERLARIIAADLALYCAADLRAWSEGGSSTAMPPELARDLAEGRRLFALRVPAEIARERDFLGEALANLARRNGARP